MRSFREGFRELRKAVFKTPDVRLYYPNLPNIYWGFFYNPIGTYRTKPTSVNGMIPSGNQTWLAEKWTIEIGDVPI